MLRREMTQYLCYPGKTEISAGNANFIGRFGRLIGNDIGGFGYLTLQLPCRWPKIGQDRQSASRIAVKVPNRTVGVSQTVWCHETWSETDILSEESDTQKRSRPSQCALTRKSRNVVLIVYGRVEHSCQNCKYLFELISAVNMHKRYFPVAMFIW
jgi:hypothetical protein